MRGGSDIQGTDDRCKQCTPCALSDPPVISSPFLTQRQCIRNRNADNWQVCLHVSCYDWTQLITWQRALVVDPLPQSVITEHTQCVPHGVCGGRACIHHLPTTIHLYTLEVGSGLSGLQMKISAMNPAPFFSAGGRLSHEICLRRSQAAGLVSEAAALLFPPVHPRNDPMWPAASIGHQSVRTLLQ